MHKKLIIAGGGTGGHIFPAIAIANALQRKDPSIQILFVGAKGKMEMEKVPQAGYAIEGLDIAGFNRSSLIKNIALPFKLVKSFFQVRKIFKAFRPDAVIGVGGYSTFPVLKYAQSKRIPTFIHESNSFAGKANILLGKNATKVFTATDGMEKFFPADRILITGNPVRQSIATMNISRETALQYFSLSPDKITVLVVGGSLGARSVNEAVAAHVDELLKAGLQLIWQTGKTLSKEAMEIAVAHKEIWANEFITEMQYAYAAADIIMARAGAMTVAEICVAQKPVIFVPYPFATEDHQTVNALQLVNKGAAWLVKDEAAKDTAIGKVIELAKDEATRKYMSGVLATLSVTDADERVANEILKTI
ncbi:undecaprenyldiphospho-muramoylpentapeptide beta-N-acetylglucosaminyltransferase [Niabella drilacis]|uniref:UDP-N-acetylglucosamine--N-acetylmuramyl-(pentapeptide) pyrophosphoryl-undecaprenol N-acetylglucosamine transferase n=1 Tax=Niabella drilacis (strain DSM 25811 / CCM 8410 / CCUG 62505 / LMG 26954 / E90) TaxID=1285928 RepID=A0A1G6T2S3_NIADE|nr:undecaprenyldiphospho-muramoylpentapeptide beta-N-acetylglucosaminyltransferase [Niabella drilacis]SDD22767.1 UDP-N-acetylglucosamine-N-acetylmuramylpentapeptide N-acetylglucosamine transferase [Niabella drilacis]